ncbi:MAG: glycosyltransferase family 39 protein [Sulfuricella sp.]|nr:glycosyltransferase family 39 protein [Sulfuricella sp.]
MTPSPPSTQRGLILLLAVVLLVWFGTLDYRHLVKPDEGRYAEIPREMAASGDWLTPRLNDIKYFEKPALQYWATASAYKLFGEHEWTARLWSALTGFLGVVLVYFTGRRLWGAEAGLYAAGVLASSLLYVLIGHLNTLDMGVTFFMGLSLAGFLLAQRPGAGSDENRLWMHVTWAALAFSVLSKGLIGLVLPGAVLVLYTLIERDWALWKRLHLIGGLALFLLISAPWFIAVSLANPEFFHFFFIHEHFERFLTKAHHRYQPWWSFVPVLALGILPWITLMLDALARAWKGDSAESNPLPGPLPPAGEGDEVSLREFYANDFKPQRFLLIWSAFIFLFFSASSSKLPSYILPIFPALALLIGMRLTQISTRALFGMLVPIAVLAGVALLLSPFAVTFASAEVPVELYRAYAVWLAAAALVWLVGSLLGLYLLKKERRRAGILAFALSGLVFAQTALTGHESLSPSNSAWLLARQIQPYLKPDAPFYSVGMYEQTLPFYIKRSVTLVAFQDEMEFGLTQEPGRWLPTFAEFEQAWKKQPYALAIMQPDTLQQFKASGLPMQIIAQDTRRVVIKKP